MTPRQQIKSLLVTSDPITVGLRQETDMLLDDNHIIDVKTLDLIVEYAFQLKAYI